MEDVKMWERKEIEEMLEKSQYAVERGIVAIYERQTKDEKNKGETIVNNGVGFNGCDGSYMSYLAKWILKGNHLSGKHFEKGKERIMKYAGQLTKIANEEL